MNPNTIESKSTKIPTKIGTFDAVLALLVLLVSSSPSVVLSTFPPRQKLEADVAGDITSHIDSAINKDVSVSTSEIFDSSIEECSMDINSIHRSFTTFSENKMCINIWKKSSTKRKEFKTLQVANIPRVIRTAVDNRRWTYRTATEQELSWEDGDGTLFCLQTLRS